MSEQMARVGCWNCGGEGCGSHYCGEDVCSCVAPEDNVRCDVCNGKGSYVVPASSLVEDDDFIEYVDGPPEVSG